MLLTRFEPDRSVEIKKIGCLDSVDESIAAGMSAYVSTFAAHLDYPLPLALCHVEALLLF
jgi:hypothetical protein